MQAYELTGLLRQQADSGRAYLEFLREGSMSMGLYVLPAGGEDPQQPHTEDEAYFVIAGRAQFHCDGEDREVAAGSVLYVAKGLTHRFHSIEEDLHILVFFAPPEGSLST